MPGVGPAAEVSFGRAQDRLFVLAKGPKTIDAPSGFIEEEGRELFAERPNSPGSHKGRQMRRASLREPAGRRQKTMLFRVRTRVVKLA